MATMTYKEQLLHPSWQRRRLEMLEKASFTCDACGSAENTLHVHHRRYIKGRMVWEYEDRLLEVLCVGCHKTEHAHREILDRLLSESNAVATIEMAIGLIAGYLDANLSIDSELRDAAIAVDGHSYDLGMLSAIASGCSWAKMHAAAQIVRPSSLNPATEGAIVRWATDPGAPPA